MRGLRELLEMTLAACELILKLREACERYRIAWRFVDGFENSRSNAAKFHRLSANPASLNNHGEDLFILSC
jgi:hypothetical protein